MRGAGDRVSELFFTKNLNEKKKYFFSGVVGGGGYRVSEYSLQRIQI